MGHCGQSRSLVSSTGNVTDVDINFVDWLDHQELVDCNEGQDGRLQIHLSKQCSMDDPSTQSRVCRFVARAFGSKLQQHVHTCIDGEEVEDEEDLVHNLIYA